MAITASEARKKLFPLIAQVNDDRLPVEIISKAGDAVLMSKADYDSLMETAFLLRTNSSNERPADFYPGRLGRFLVLATNGQADAQSNK